MSHFKKLTFLKVLSTIAWADGELSNSELNIIKSFYRKFNLDNHQVSELRPYLAAPIPKKEQDDLFRQLVVELKSPKERKEIIKDLEAMANADKKIKDEEKDLLDKFAKLVAETNITKRSFGKIRNLFKHTILQLAREKDHRLSNYFKDTVLRKVELKTESRGNKINIDDDQLYFICLFGTLLASVAYVDDNFDANEKKALKKRLNERFSFNKNDLSILFEIIEEQARQGIDRHDVVTEFNRIVSYNDRLNTVDCFFAIASADGDISHDEMEEIRDITKAMRIPHKAFITSKLKFLNKLRSGKK
ncbi:MAG: TerB family tellurite resistance protein [Nitrospinales bacterium]